MINSSARSMLIRSCLERFSKPRGYLSVKCMSGSTGNNIVRSSYPDVEISKLSLSNYLLENVKDNVDKPAIVSANSLWSSFSWWMAMMMFVVVLKKMKIVLWPFGDGCVICSVCVCDDLSNRFIFERVCMHSTIWACSNVNHTMTRRISITCYLCTKSYVFSRI